MSPAEAGAGGRAEDLVLVYPSGLAADTTGAVYIADRADGTSGRFIWRVTPEGRVEHVAGNGRRGAPDDNAIATETSLGSPEGIRTDAQGRLYIADSHANVVLRLEHDGTISRIAGRVSRGDGGYGGDGGPATEAKLNVPFDVALDSAGNLYIADLFNNRIRRVSTAGIITTYAGTGAAGYTGDGGPASSARLNGPYGVAIDNQDRLLIADSFNHVIRRVERDGTIHTIAGSGERGYAGDGGPALEAQFNAPQALFVDDDDTIFIGDEHNHAIRALRPDGTVVNIIGTGKPGFAQLGVPVEGASVNDPEMVIRLEGALLIVENENDRVIRIDDDGRVELFAGCCSDQ